MGLRLLSDVLDRFALEHAQVQLDVHYLDRMVDLVGERFDLAIRVGHLPDSSLRARRIASYGRRLVASPALASELGTLSHPGQLRGRPAVVYTGNLRAEDWTLRRGDEVVTVPITRRMASNSGRAVGLAAANGLGLAYVPTFHTRDLEEAGRLVRLLPEWGEEVPVHVVFPSAEHLPLRIRTLIDFLATECSRATGLPGSRHG